MLFATIHVASFSESASGLLFVEILFRNRPIIFRRTSLLQRKNGQTPTHIFSIVHEPFVLNKFPPFSCQFFKGTKRYLTETKRYGVETCLFSVSLLYLPAARDFVGDQVQTARTPKCTFSGVVPIEAKRFLDSGTRLVEYPDCAAMRSLDLQKGMLRFKSHDKRKTTTPNTEERWVRVDLVWDVVGG